MKKLLTALSFVLFAFAFQVNAATFDLTNSRNANHVTGNNAVADAFVVSKGNFNSSWFFSSNADGTTKFRIEGNEPKFSLKVFIDSIQVLTFAKDTTDKIFNLDFLAGQKLTFKIAGSSNSFDVVSFKANAVPVPAAVWLFGSGLMGLIGRSRCKKALA